MDLIRNLVQTLIIIVVLAVFLEMLLPRGTMMPYVRMVMGLLVIIAVLQAISGSLHQDWFQSVPSVKPQSGQTAAGLEEIMVSGRQMQLKNQEKAAQEYREGIAKQVLALANLNPAARVVDARVDISSDPETRDFGQIKKITLLVDPKAGETKAENTSIRPVRIEVGRGTNSIKEVPEEVPSQIVEAARSTASTIANFYNLPSQAVVVEYQTTGGN